MGKPSVKDAGIMRLALRLASRGQGMTSPNPMVGAVLVRNGRIIGRGWHHRAGLPHAEIEALRNAQARGRNAKGSTLFVTLEPCCTHGRTPPCTDAIIAAGICKVVVAAVDPNPLHSGRAFAQLKKAGVEVIQGVLAEKAEQLNEAFNHWIVHGTPFVTVKAAMTLDGKIAAASGESKWISGSEARAYGMRLRHAADAILVGINTVLADNPSLTVRPVAKVKGVLQNVKRRIILDSDARTPLDAKVLNDQFAAFTTIVVSDKAPKNRVIPLADHSKILVAPTMRIKNQSQFSTIDLGWLMKKLGGEAVTSLLVEGGGEVNASFLLGGFAQRSAFFYAPKILGGRSARKAVAGAGISHVRDMIRLHEVDWKWLGADLLLTGKVARRESTG